MRWIFAVFIMVVPLLAVAEPICPAGYVFGRFQLCEQKWKLSSESCAQSNYYDTTSKRCLPRCPYRSKMEMSTKGDLVCQKEGKREWLEEYSQKCAAKKMRYLPQIDRCLVPPTPTAEQQREPENTDCEAGTVARIKGGVFSCVKGNPQKALQKMEERLKKQGLGYVEYLEVLKDIQTSKFAAEVMYYRWEEATGRRQTKEQKEKAILSVTNCPKGYLPTVEGGCKPELPCRSYGCPEGQISLPRKEGRNAFCRCEPIRRIK